MPSSDWMSYDSLNFNFPHFFLKATVLWRRHQRLWNPPLHDTTGCQIRLYNRFDNRLYRVNKHPTGCQLSNGFGNRFDKHGLTTGWMFVYMIQPVVKPVVKRVWQPVWQPCWMNSCSFNRLSNRVVQPVWQRVWQPVVSCTQTFTRLSNRYPVVKPVWQPVWQQVVSCRRGFDKSTPVSTAFVHFYFSSALTLISFALVLGWVFLCESLYHNDSLHSENNPRTATF